MTIANKCHHYNKALQHLTLWGCLANICYRRLGAVAAVALTVGMVPQVSLASISQATFYAQLKSVDEALNLSEVKRNEKLIELSRQGNIVADMTLYRYITRGDTIEYTLNETNVAQAIYMLNSNIDDKNGLIGLFKGLNYWSGNLNNEKNYDMALIEFKKSAFAGNASAMFMLGIMFEKGQGIKENTATATKWYQKASEMGSYAAMHNLAFNYENGKGGLVQDYNKAMQWYQKSLKGGLYDAAVNIGIMYAKGKGVEQNKDIAAQWYQKAAKAGNDKGMFNTAYYYEIGEGSLPQDYHKSMHWYLKSANLGNPKSMFKIGEFYANGKGVSQNTNIALNWYKKSNIAEAKNNIGVMYETGQGVNKDINIATQWYLESFEDFQNKSSYKDINNFKLIKKNLENLLATNKITDPTIRKQVEAIFAKPPLITWQTSPPSTINNDTLNLSVLLTDQGGGIGDVRVLLDGVAIDQSSRGLGRQVNQTTRNFTLSIPKGSHTITVEAYPGDNIGVTSKVVKQITSTYAPVQKPKLHAVVIGVDNYNNPKLKLNYAVTDAQAMYNTLNKQIGGLYDKGNITLLTSKPQTSKASITKAITDVQDKARMGDVFVFYAASHGFNYPNAGYYLFTSNVGATSVEQVQNAAIDAENLQDLLAQVKTDKKLILLDTCDSGGSIDAGALLMSRGMDDQSTIERMKRKSGATVLMASNDQQKALEGYKGHGLFTYGLLQALQGQADIDKDGYTDTDELKRYTEKQIPILAQQAFNQAQYPTASTFGHGFEFKVVD